MSNRLKVIYFFDWSGRVDAGVVKKVRDQLSTWKVLGVEVELIFLTNQRVAEIEFNVPTEIFHFSSPWQRLKARKRAILFAETKGEDWIMYRRYALMTPIEVTSMRRIRTVIELNTNNEAFYRQRNLIQFTWFKIQNRWIGNFAAGACAVTEEIRNLNLGNFNQISVFTNAINLELFTEKNGPNQSNKLIFLAGDDFSWNGNQILGLMADSLTGYEIDVLGLPNQRTIKPNLHYYDYLPSEELAEKLQGYLAGISTLQLENIGLTEAAPLKTRHYLSNGLPVIGRFKDSGLSADFPFYFKIILEEKDSKIQNRPELIRFLNNCKMSRVQKEDLDSIEINNVENQRIKYLKSLL